MNASKIDSKLALENFFCKFLSPLSPPYLRMKHFNFWRFYFILSCSLKNHPIRFDDQNLSEGFSVIGNSPIARSDFRGRSKSSVNFVNRFSHTSVAPYTSLLLIFPFPPILGPNFFEKLSREVNHPNECCLCIRSNNRNIPPIIEEKKNCNLVVISGFYLTYR